MSESKNYRIAHRHFNAPFNVKELEVYLLEGWELVTATLGVSPDTLSHEGRLQSYAYTYIFRKVT